MTPGARRALGALLLAAGVFFPSSAAAARFPHPMGVCGKFDERNILERIPGCSGFATRSGRRIWMTYNSRGLRDKDYPPKPAPGVVRVLFIGGSVAVGSGLEEKDTPARRLEEALRAKRLKAEVVDAAGEGFTSWQNAAVLRELIAAYAPKVVIYHLMGHYLFADRAFWRDLRRVNGRIAARQQSLRFLLAAAKGWPAARKLLKFFLLNSQEQIGRILSSWKMWTLRGADERTAYLMEPTLAELEQMQAIARETGVRFVVVYDGEDADNDQFPIPQYPLHWMIRLAQGLFVRPFRVDGAAVTDSLRRNADAAGYRLISLSDDRAALVDPANRLEEDYHWNERGSRLFADALAREYAKKPDATGKSH